MKKRLEEENMSRIDDLEHRLSTGVGFEGKLLLKMRRMRALYEEIVQSLRAVKKARVQRNCNNAMWHKNQVLKSDFLLHKLLWGEEWERKNQRQPR